MWGRYPLTWLNDLTKDFSFAHQANHVLSALTQHYNFPDLILGGLPGSGKRVRLYAFLQKLFNQSKPISITATTLKYFDSGEKKKEKSIHLLQSSYHSEMDLSNWKGVQQENVLKTVLHQFVESSQSPLAKKLPFKLLILYHSETLSKSSQATLLRFIEQNVHFFRVIFSTTNIHCFLPALKSRCMQIWIESPSSSEIISVLKNTLNKIHELKLDEIPMNYQLIPNDVFEEIEKNCNFNLHVALYMLEQTLKSKENKDNISTIILCGPKLQIRNLLTLFLEMSNSTREKEAPKIHRGILEFHELLGRHQKCDSLIAEFNQGIAMYFQRKKVNLITIQLFLQVQRAFYNRRELPLPSEILYWYFYQIALILRKLNK